MRGRGRVYGACGSHALLAAFLLLQAPSAHAITDNCWNWVNGKEHDFFIRGSRDSLTPGARLWDLQGFVSYLARETSLSAGDEACATESFEQAMNDQVGYWNHISKKYDCPEETSGAPRRARPVCRSVYRNSKFARFLKSSYDLVKKNTPEEPCAESLHDRVVRALGVSPDLIKNIRNVLGASNEPVEIAKSDGSSCGKVPLEKRYTQESDDEESWAHRLLDCPKTFGKTLKDAVGLYSDPVESMTEKEKDQLVKRVMQEGSDGPKTAGLDPSAESAIRAQVVTHPIEIDSQARNHFLTGFFRSRIPLFDCYKRKYQRELACQYAATYYERPLAMVAAGAYLAQQSVATITTGAGWVKGAWSWLRRVGAPAVEASGAASAEAVAATGGSAALKNAKGLQDVKKTWDVAVSQAREELGAVRKDLSKAIADLGQSAKGPQARSELNVRIQALLDRLHPNNFTEFATGLPGKSGENGRKLVEEITKAYAKLAQEAKAAGHSPSFHWP